MDLLKCHNHQIHVYNIISLMNFEQKKYNLTSFESKIFVRGLFWAYFCYIEILFHGLFYIRQENGV